MNQKLETIKQQILKYRKYIKLVEDSNKVTKDKSDSKRIEMYQQKINQLSQEYLRIAKYIALNTPKYEKESSILNESSNSSTNTLKDKKDSTLVKFDINPFSELVYE